MAYALTAKTQAPPPPFDLLSKARVCGVACLACSSAPWACVRAPPWMIQPLLSS